MKINKILYIHFLLILFLFKIYDLTAGQGKSRLHEGAQLGFTEWVEQEIEENQAPVDAKWEGCTALHLALKNNWNRVAKYLIEKGADVNEKDLEGNTPLHYALAHCAYYDKNIVFFIIQNGGNIYALNTTNQSPLHLAASRDNIDIVKYFVRHSVNLHTKETDDDSQPLHYAAYFGSFNTVKYLVNYGADIYAQCNIQQESPSFWWWKKPRTIQQTPFELAEKERYEHKEKYKREKKEKKDDSYYCKQYLKPNYKEKDVQYLNIQSYLRNVKDYYEHGSMKIKGGLQKEETLPNYFCLAVNIGHLYNIHTLFDPTQINNLPAYITTVQLPENKEDSGIRELVWLYLLKINKIDNISDLESKIESFNVKNKSVNKVLTHYKLYKQKFLKPNICFHWQ